MVESLRKSTLLLLYFVHFKVELFSVILLQVVFDRTKDSSEGLSVEFQQFAALWFDSDAQWSFLVVNQSKLTKMSTALECSHQDKAFPWANLMELQTIHVSSFNDVEFFSILSFSENKFSFIQGDLLEAIDQLQFLEFIKSIEKFDFVQKSSLETSFLDATLNGDCFENSSVESIGLTSIYGLNSGWSLIVV